MSLKVTGLISMMLCACMMNLTAQDTSIEVIVYDSNTNDPIESALVSILWDGTVIDSVYTDINGRANIYIPVTNVREPTGLPSTISLSNNYPNPFNDNTNVEMSVPEAQTVTASVYNILGQRVSSEQIRISGGNYTLNLSLGHLPMGVYFLRVGDRESQAVKLTKLGSDIQYSGSLFSVSPSSLPVSGSISKSNDGAYTLRAHKEKYDVYETSVTGTENGEIAIPLTRNVEYEPGTVTDIDGNVYPIVQIGDQWWLAENLRVTHYRNGDPIIDIIDVDWRRHGGVWMDTRRRWDITQESPPGSLYPHIEQSQEVDITYEPDEANSAYEHGVLDENGTVYGSNDYWVYISNLGYGAYTIITYWWVPGHAEGWPDNMKEWYGLLYNFPVVLEDYNGRGLCPEGWRVATDDDWRQLEEFLGIPNPWLDVEHGAEYGWWMHTHQIEHVAEKEEFGGRNAGGKLKSTRSLRPWLGFAEGTEGNYYFDLIGAYPGEDDGTAEAFAAQITPGSTEIRIMGRYGDDIDDRTSETHIVESINGERVYIQGTLAHDYQLWIRKARGPFHADYDYYHYPGVEIVNQPDELPRWGSSFYPTNIGATNEYGFNALPSPSIISHIRGGGGYTQRRAQWWTPDFERYLSTGEQVNRLIRGRDTAIDPDDIKNDSFNSALQGHRITRRVHTGRHANGFNVRCVKE